MPCIYTSTHDFCIYACVSIFVDILCMCVDICMYLCMCVDICMYLCMCVDIRMYLCMCVDIMYVCTLNGPRCTVDLTGIVDNVINDDIT